MTPHVTDPASAREEELERKENGSLTHPSDECDIFDRSNKKRDLEEKRQKSEKEKSREKEEREERREEEIGREEKESEGSEERGILIER